MRRQRMVCFPNIYESPSPPPVHHPLQWPAAVAKELVADAARHVELQMQQAFSKQTII